MRSAAPTDDRVERIRAAVAPHGATLLDAKPLHGGACQELFRCDVTLDGRPIRLALRADAKESLPLSLKRAEEYAVVQAAVTGGVATPPARWLTKDLLRPGADAYFMDWADGEALGRRVVRNPELEAARTALPDQLARSLAAIHRITPATTPLPFSAPTTSPSAHTLTQLRTMLDGIPTPMPAIEFALHWAHAHQPTNEPITLVHGDFRTGNFLVTPTGLSAILDWEFAHWGSPAEDLGWISVRDWRFGRLDKPIGGFSTREPFYRAYEAASGRHVDRTAIHWWEVVGNLRWAIGSAYQGERYLRGAEQDLELIAIARRSVEMEFEALRLIRTGAR